LYTNKAKIDVLLTKSLKSHLLEKIQALGKSVFKKQEATTTTVNGEPRPKPIKRRMLL